MTTTSFSIRRWLFRLILGTGLVALVMLALAVVFIAVPLTRRVLIVALAEWMLGGRLESLAVDLDLQPNLRWIFTLLIVLPVGFGLARAIMARRFSSALRGLALAAGTLLLLVVAVWWNTRHFNFDAKGRPVVYLGFRRDGVHKSYSPGIDRVTGRPKYEATVDRIQWLSELARQPVREVDPAGQTNWFDANSGEPNLWYVQLADNRWQFFNRPHFHQQLRIEVSPVTPELMAQWQAEHDRQAAAAQALQRRREAEARSAAEKEKREEEDRAEHLRQADIRIRAEAQAGARLEAERREREAQLTRDQEKLPVTEPSAQEAPRTATAPSVAPGPTYDWQTPRRSATESPRWIAVPAQSQPGWVQPRIVEPVGSIVRMPFQIVGSVFGGVARSAGGRRVQFVTVSAGARPPGSVTASPVVRPAGYRAPATAPVWLSPSPRGYATPSRAPANSGTSGHRYGRH
jgi:hypothetical protein